MPRDYFDRTPEEEIIVLIDEENLRQTEILIESCEGCDREAETPFDAILDRITASDPRVTEYILETPARCPKCRGDILEKTLVKPALLLGRSA